MKNSPPGKPPAWPSTGGLRAFVPVGAKSIASNATSDQVIRQARRISGLCEAAAKHGPRRRGLNGAGKQADRGAKVPRGQHRDAEDQSHRGQRSRGGGQQPRSRRPRDRPNPATSHQGKGGFSSHGRPPIVGYIHSPELRISLAPCSDKRFMVGQTGRSTQTREQGQGGKAHQAGQVR